MGTFHDDKGELHGITIVAEAGDLVYVGRCDTIDDASVVLLDCDVHAEGEDGKSNADWLQRAARFGVWKKHDRLALPRGDVRAVTPLADFVRKGDSASRPLAPVSPAIGEDPPKSESVAGDAVVTLTETARAEVRRLLAAEARPGSGLRLGVAGGGCSGLVYKVEFDVRKEGDVVVAHDGFDVLLDRKSTIYLRGVTLDHQAGLSGRGFVFRNPNASNTCGCGESFAV